MKKSTSFLCVVFLFLVGIFVSCSQGVSPTSIPTPTPDPNPSSYTRKITYKNTDPKYKYYMPQDSSDTIFWDDFEGEAITSKNPWTYTNYVELTSFKQVRDKLIEDNPGKTWCSGVFGGSESKVIKLTDKGYKTSVLTYENLTIHQDCYLTFRYSFIAVPQSTFKVILDGNTEVFSINGVNSSTSFSVSTVSVKVPAGTKSITFKTQNNNGSTYTTWPSGAFIDDVSLVYDKVSSVIVTPQSSQKTYVGCSEKERIRAQAYPLRADGTYVENVAVSFSSPKGNFDSKGYFTPTVAGTTKITANCNGVTGTSGQITVASSNSCEGSVTVAGVTYTGTKTVSGTLLSAQDPNYSNFNAKIAFEYPQKDTVTADGFVRIKGKLTPSTNGSSEYNKVVIYVSSAEASDSDYANSTVYLCDADFDLRVWLPFEGTNKISVYPADIIYSTYTDENGKTCEGDFKQWRYIKSYTINATNTRSSSTDKMYIYPSYFCQADSPLVQNWTNEALYGLPSNASAEEKFQAIHDYICLSLYYDDDSISTKGTRKKQDAVSVIKNRMAVCEGYANLTAAMSRYAGIPSGVVISNAHRHAWNHVWINGTELFCDTTWDDPEEDPASTYFTYNYYLLTNFDGINDDHKDANQYFASRYAGCEQNDDEVGILYQLGFVF